MKHTKLVLLKFQTFPTGDDLRRFAATVRAAIQEVVGRAPTGEYQFMGCYGGPWHLKLEIPVEQPEIWPNLQARIVGAGLPIADMLVQDADPVETYIEVLAKAESKQPAAAGSRSR